jgi:hypothetical protein
VLARALAAQGIDAPFPIQTATLPDSLAGKDVLGRGRTGSGKTLAFSLPLVTRLVGGSRRPKQPRALVLVPTRELANQVHAVVDPLVRAVGLTSTVVFGGVGQNPQVKALSAGVDVLIACPGRLEDLIGQGFCDLSGVEITILDEADHMADLGFLPAVKRLLDRTPPRGQRMLFSATLDNGVDVLVKRYLSSPVTHSVDPAVSPVSTMTHHVFSVSAADKADVVRELASGQDRSLLFMRTKHTAKKLAKQLTAAGVPAVELHGNLSQGAASATCRPSPTAAPGCWSPPTSPPRASTSTTSPWWCTSTRRPSTRPTCTAPAAPPAPAPGARSSRWPPRPGGEVRSLAKQAGIRPRRCPYARGPEITELTGPPAAYVEPAPVVEQPPAGRARGPRSPQPQGAGRSRSGRSGATPAGPAKAASSGGGAKSPSRTAGPARTRAELAARAGQAPSARRPRSH